MPYGYISWENLSIGVRDMQQMPKVERMDNCEEKRIELHMHSQMSTMDATTEAAQLVATAARWGHPAVAITDHGSAQAFPSAFGAAKKNNIKLIPGVEGYLVDMVPIVKDADDRPLSSPIVVLDFETTGLSTVHDRIIEVGAVKLVDGQIVDELSFLCDPGVPLKPKITRDHRHFRPDAAGQGKPGGGRDQAAGLYRRRGGSGP